MAAVKQYYYQRYQPHKAHQGKVLNEGCLVCNPAVGLGTQRCTHVADGHIDRKLGGRNLRRTDRHGQSNNDTLLIGPSRTQIDISTRT